MESAYTNGEASVGLGVTIDDYDEDVGEYPGSDVISMNISMTTNSRVGISYEYDIGGLWWIDEGLLYPRNDVDLGDDDGT